MGTKAQIKNEVNKENDKINDEENPESFKYLRETFRTAHSLPCSLNPSKIWLFKKPRC